MIQASAQNVKPLKFQLDSIFCKKKSYMFPTRCRTEVQSLYLVHSEFSETTTLSQGHPNTKVSLHGNNACHTKHDFCYTK